MMANLQTALGAIDDLGLRLHAAIVSYFDPLEILGTTSLVDDDRAALIDGLAELCDHVMLPGQTRRYWSMRQAARMAVVKSVDEAGLTEPERVALIEAVPVSADDQFGTHLQSALLGRDPLDALNEDDVDTDELLRAIRVAGVIQNMDEVERQVRRYIARRDADEMLQVVMPSRLVGRDDEMDALTGYCAEQLPPGPSIPSYVLTGPGGVGKSALVSTFVYNERHTVGRAPLIYFDFDRASLAEADAQGLTFEFSRQLGYLDPTLDAAMTEFRERMRRLASTGGPTSKVSVSRGSALSTYIELGGLLQDWAFRDQAVTIVFDTFEEVAIRGTDAVRTVLRWASQLRNEAGLPQLHLIITGREVEPDMQLRDTSVRAEMTQLFAARHRRELRDLDPDAARSLLEIFGVDPVRAAELPAVFGGNPLVVSLLSKFIDANSSTEVSKLIADGRASRDAGAPVGELGLQFVYRRILSRIKDTRVRRLAYPGIALRRVTPELIEEVLAPFVGDEMRIASSDDALALFNALAGHVWLVRRLHGTVVEHRRDTRRLMVSTLEDDPELDMQALHWAAAQYYARRPPEVPVDIAFVEEAYHRGFLDEIDESMTEQEAQLVKRRLGEDMRFWPPHARAVVKSIGGYHIEMTEEEVGTLGGGLLGGSARNARVEQRLQLGFQPDIGFEVAQASRQLDGAFDFSGDRIDVEPVEFQLAFRQARFGFLANPERAVVAIDRFFGEAGYSNSSTSDVPWLIGLSLVIVDATPQRIFSDLTLAGLENLGPTLQAMALSFAGLADDRRAMAHLEEQLSQLYRLDGWPLATSQELLSLQAAASASDLAWVGRFDHRFDAPFEALCLPNLRAIPVAAEHQDQYHDVLDRFLGPGVQRFDQVVLNRFREELAVLRPEITGLDGVRTAAATNPLFYPPLEEALGELPVERQRSIVAHMEGLPYWVEEYTVERLFADDQRLELTYLSAICETADRAGRLYELADQILIHQPGDVVLGGGERAAGLELLRDGIPKVATKLAPLARLS